MKRFLAISGLVLVTLAASQVANATEIRLTVGKGGVVGVDRDHILGEIIPSAKAAAGLLLRDEAMIDTLLAVKLGDRTGSGTQADPYYYRSTTDFGALPDAVQAGAIGTPQSDLTGTASTVTVTLPATFGFTYLLAAYDGKNGGAEVWYVGDIAAGTTIIIPRFAKPVGTAPDINLVEGKLVEGKFGMTSWSLFNPTKTPGDPDPTSVPDGGTTAALLGLAMVGLGCLRRFKG